MVKKKNWKEVIVTQLTEYLAIELPKEGKKTLLLWLSSKLYLTEHGCSIKARKFLMFPC